jgi:hypothetical protein
MAEWFDTKPADYVDYARDNERGGFGRRAGYVRDVGAERRLTLYQASQFIWLVNLMLEGFLTATPSAAGMVLEIPTLIAMLVYLLMAWVVVRLIWVLFDRPTARRVFTDDCE